MMVPIHALQWYRFADTVKIPREALAASVEMALKDHENGNTVSHSELMSRIKAERGWK